MESFSDDEKQKLVRAGIVAVENQTKLAEAAMIAAVAFSNLVRAVEKLVEREMNDGK